MSTRRNVEKQEAVVAALHSLLRETEAAKLDGTANATGGLTLAPCYRFSTAVVGKALASILETFGYAVTEIQ